MRTLVVDNYDSFTYNLVQYLGELGEDVIVRRNDAVKVSRVEKEIAPDRILISPGPGTPDDAGVSMEMIDHFAGKVPILGVCLGHQAIARVYGGKIVRAPVLVHGKATEIQHDGKSVFEGLEPMFQAGRYHSLIVERETLPSCLEISATTEDGIIMGLRHKKMKLEGVQFHPESILTGEGKQLLANFLKM
jgi:anthranilate synthase/aminodeoxychorismate synthase-like glutamine amidotransferase